jgi:hypothetical protein
MAYEADYNEARNTLYRRGKAIGRPYYGEDGVRRCPVGGVALVDRDLFREAWGERLTTEILKERDSATAEFHCDACMDLWTAYTETAKLHLKVFAQQRDASLRDRAENESGLDGITERRSVARQALLKHADTHRWRGAAA